eukprot:15366299-Ditylum_brightwellii.AAC.3
MAKTSMIKNCLVTVEDIENANKIFGSDTAALTGKTVWYTQDRVNMYYVAVSPDLIKLHKTIDLDIDILYANKMHFLVSHVKHIFFATLEHIVDNTNKGFVVRSISMESEFESLTTA